MVTGIIMLVIFLIMALLMYLEKISTILVLPLMGFLFVITAVTSNLITGGVVNPAPEKAASIIVNLNNIWSMYWAPLSDIFAKGSIKLANVIITTIFGGMLAVYIKNLKIAERMIYWTAEFAGDKAFGIGIALFLVTFILFTSVGGLGSVIMIGTIILPILGSVGISPVAGAGIFLFGICAGGTINPGNLKLYSEVFGIQQGEVIKFAYYSLAIYFATVFLWMLVTISKASISNFGIKKMASGNAVKKISPYIIAALVIAVIVVYAKSLSTETITSIKSGKDMIINSIFVLFCLSVVFKLVKDFLLTKKEEIKPGELSLYSFLAPIVPVVLVFQYGIDPIAAFIVTIVYTFVVSIRRSTIRLFCKSLIEGAQVVMPASILMLGIGILLQAVLNESVNIHLKPILNTIIPKGWLAYIVGFTLVAPLALYRGPLNVWGLGFGLGALILQSGNLPAQAIMGMLISVGMVQGVCDPTNTHNVWIASFQGTTPNIILRKTLPFTWIAAGALITISSLLYMYGVVGK